MTGPILYEKFWKTWILKRCLGGGFKDFWIFTTSHNLGKISNLMSIFFRWVGQPPTRCKSVIIWGGLIWHQPGTGRVISERDEHVERVPLVSLDALQVRRRSWWPLNFMVREIFLRNNGKIFMLFFAHSLCFGENSYGWINKHQDLYFRKMDWVSNVMAVSICFKESQGFFWWGLVAYT